MGLFTKKEAATDKLSDIPQLPDLPASNQNALPIQSPPASPNLPVLPNYDRPNHITITEVSDNDEGFYETPITDMEKSSYPKINAPEKSAQMDEISKIINPVSTTQKGFTPVKNVPVVKSAPVPIERKLQKKEEQIFVKLKKFEDSIESFNGIRAKIDELTEELEKAKKLVIDEQKELEEWAKEITIIKSGLEAIDKNLFSGFES
jgi:hypothetical protein